MKDEMKKRLALLGILLVAGFAMAGIATAFGAGNLVKGNLVKGKKVRIESVNDQLKIYENGKLVKEIKLPEGEYNFTIEAAGHRLTHKLVVRKMTSEEMKEKVAEYQEKLNKWLEIANKDSRIQELTNGEGIQYKEGKYILLYSITTREGKPVPVGEPADTVILAFKVNGKIYEVKIDLKNEIVISVEERSSK